MTTDHLSLSIFVNKYFLPVRESAEKKLADLYFLHGRNFSYKNTQFYKLRTGQANWLAPGFANIPSDLSCPPLYWVMPWADKFRKPDRFLTKLSRRIHFPGLLNDFFKIADSIQRGFDNSKEPIKGYSLHHCNGETRFIYTDGNRRLGILSSICFQRRIPLQRQLVKVDIRGEYHQDELLNYPEVQSNMEKYKFSQKDVMTWFENAF